MVLNIVEGIGLIGIVPKNKCYASLMLHIHTEFSMFLHAEVPASSR